MSSDESAGTNSSRLRQFGLYRNIDERTEEFLKLSRKRQIRQGCACAAVSTAITVTIVVSVLIAFQFGFHSDPEPTLQPKHKPNWFMLNDSEVKFDINQQHANIKSSVILPLLLKALKQNRILEKAIEEYSSNTPDEHDTTDYPLERNIFTDARNWMRMPPARMYAFEYKTSPIVFFKSRNIDEFYKARKIMDSRRVTNYLDRMMNDKTAYVTREANNGETDNTVKKMSSTASPKRATTHFARLEERNKSTTKKDTATTTKKTNLDICNCPSNLKDVLQKLLLSVQKLYSLSRKKTKIASKDCDSITCAQEQQAKKNVASRGTATTERSPKVTSTDSYLPLDLFKKIIPEASSTTTLSETLVRTIQSTTGKIDFASSLISETTRKQNYAHDTVNETTFKPYLEVPVYTTTVTTTKPMTPVTTEDDTHRVMSTEHFMKRLQKLPIYPSQYVNYDLNDVQLNPTTVINPTKVKTYDEVWGNEEDEENKKQTLSNFLFKYKESQKKNKVIEDNRIGMFGDHLLDSETMRIFNVKNELIKDELKVRRKIKLASDAKKVNGSSFLKSKSKITAAKHKLETVIRNLTASHTVPFNITYGSIRIPNDSNEKPISALPQLSPPFLQIRRNEGGQEENEDYANKKFLSRTLKKKKC